MWLWIGLANAWNIAGPERGHVLDVDVASHEILLTTRVGVMRTTPDTEVMDKRCSISTRYQTSGDMGYRDRIRRRAFWSMGCSSNATLGDKCPG